MNDRWRDEERERWLREDERRREEQRRAGPEFADGYGQAGAAQFSRSPDRSFSQGQSSNDGSGYSRNQGYRPPAQGYAAQPTWARPDDHEPWRRNQGHDRGDSRGRDRGGPGFREDVAGGFERGRYGQAPARGYDKDYGRPQPHAPDGRGGERHAEGGFRQPPAPHNYGYDARHASEFQRPAPDQRHDEDRSWWDRTRHEVNSWFGQDQGDHDRHGRSQWGASEPRREPHDPGRGYHREARRDDTGWNDPFGDQRRQDATRHDPARPDSRHPDQRQQDARYLDPHRRNREAVERGRGEPGRRDEDEAQWRERDRWNRDQW